MDANFSDTDALLERLEAEFPRSRAVIYVYLAAVMVSGLLGNLLVIVVYSTKFKATTARTFMVTMAVLDLIGCVQGIPLEFVNVAKVYTYPSPVLCKWYASVNTFTSVASVLVLLVVAGDRYKRICHPLEAQLTRQNARKASLCCCVVAILLAWPNAVLWGDATQNTGIANVTGTRCDVEKDLEGTPFPLVYNGLLFVLFVGSVGVLVTFYALIYGKIRRQQRLHGGPLIREIRVPFTNVASGETTDAGPRSTPIDAPSQAAVDCSVTSPSAGCQEATSAELDRVAVSGNSSRVDQLTLDAPCHQENAPRSFSISRLKLFFKSRSTDKEPRVEISALSTEGSTEEMMLEDDDSDFADTTRQEAAADVENNAQVSDGEQNTPSGQLEGPRQIRFVASNAPKDGGQNEKMKRRAEAVRKMTLTFFLVTLIFVLSFLPYLVVTILLMLQSNSVQGEQDPLSLLYALLTRSIYLQNAINPFIYGFRNPEFRAKCWQLLCRRR